MNKKNIIVNRWNKKIIKYNKVQIYRQNLKRKHFEKNKDKVAHNKDV